MHPFLCALSSFSCFPSAIPALHPAVLGCEFSRPGPSPSTTRIGVVEASRVQSAPAGRGVRYPARSASDHMRGRYCSRPVPCRCRIAPSAWIGGSVYWVIRTRDAILLEEARVLHLFLPMTFPLYPPFLVFLHFAPTFLLSLPLVLSRSPTRRPPPSPSAAYYFHCISPAARPRVE